MHIFTKKIDITDGGFAFRIEREKATLMYEILTQEPNITTPRLLDYDESQGLLTFENIINMKSISATTEHIWFEMIGRLLAYIHCELSLPEELTIVRRKDEKVNGVVYVHGDFMPNNMCCSGEKLVVFDWGLRPWISEVYTKASPAVDLAAFLAPWWVPRWWDFKLPTIKLSRLLNTYYQTVGHDSETAQVGKQTLKQELYEQQIYWAREIQRRSISRRVLLKSKMFFNIWRMKNELFKEE